MEKEKLKEKIWAILKEIKFGETKSYMWLAEKLKMKNKVRYIAKLLSENPYPISIPCHRIVLKNGKTGGYFLGKNFKNYLLKWEKSLL